MTGKRAETFLQLMWRVEYFTLNRACEALTDDEFFWEPADNAWSVRRREDCRTPHPFGADEWVTDFQVPEPGPVPPITTIAWLFWHFGSMPGRLAEMDFLGGSRSMASGWTSPYLSHHPIFTSATDAVSALREGWQRLRDAVEQADDDRLEASICRDTYADSPPTGGLCAIGPPGPEHPASFFVAGTLIEVDHHGTQICTLRDLYAVRRGPGQPEPLSGAR